MPNYKKGEPANRSTNRKDVFTPGKVQESGSLGYMVASLMRALARSKDKKAISKLAKTPSGSSRKYPKSNVKVKKTAVKKTPQYRGTKLQGKRIGNPSYAEGAAAKKTAETRRAATRSEKKTLQPRAKKKAPAKKGMTERQKEALRQARELRARREL